MAANAIEIFEVKLDDVNRVFYPGETVGGRVNLKLKRDLTIKQMHLECRGEAYVNWPEYSGSYTRYRYNRERYFNTMAVIFGEAKRNGTTSSACISEGSYSFSFKFIIPDKYLPTSYEGRHGNIRYWARAVIERPLVKKSIKTKPARFLISDYVALEDFENVSEALVEEDSRTLGWPCCRSGTLVLRAEIDKGGYRQGDDINVSVLVTNETSRDVIFTEVSLIQRSLFVAVEGGRTFSDLTICHTTKQGVRSGWEQEFPKVSLAVPANIFPTLISCKCIAVLYFVQIRAKLKGKLMKHLYLEVPVVIACVADESVLRAQKDTALESTLHRPKKARRKGTFFCVTGRNSLTEDPDISNSEYDNPDEKSEFFDRAAPQTTRSFEEHFTPQNTGNLEYKFTSKMNPSELTTQISSGREFPIRKESETSFYVNNGQLKLMSRV